MIVSPSKKINTKEKKRMTKRPHSCAGNLFFFFFLGGGGAKICPKLSFVFFDEFLSDFNAYKLFFSEI